MLLDLAHAAILAALLRAADALALRWPRVAELLRSCAELLARAAVGLIRAILDP